MNRRKLLAASLPVLALTTPAAFAGDPPKKDLIRVETEGLLGTMTRQEGKGPVHATILAGGGELFLDTSSNKEAYQELRKLADKHLDKPGSSTFLPPRLRVKGSLEYRKPNMFGESPSQGMWVLAVDSLKVLENPLNNR